MRPFLPVCICLFLVHTALSTTAQVNNFRPQITGQTPSPLVTMVNQPITVELTNLIVVDADAKPEYPDGFTLELSSGRNYRVDQNTVTPDRNFTGMLRVPVRVDDGRQKSRRFDLEIEVKAEINKEPVITGQVELATLPGQSLEIELSHLIVNDPDDNYPDDFSLDVYNGSNYSRNRNTITPRSNFTGTLTVPVSVNDGRNDSRRYNLKITVAEAENVPPVITGQKTISIVENTSRLILLSDLTVTDPDNAYPTGFTLKVLAGDHYAVEGSTITPLPDFTNKTLIVNVAVNDGKADSPTYGLKIQVIPSSTRPRINGQKEVSMLEDTSLEITLSMLEVTDADNTNFPKGFSLQVMPGNNAGYTAVNNKITPALNLNGFIEIGVKVSDGVNLSDEFKLSVFVEPVNDAPEIVNFDDTPLNYEPGGPPLNLFEDLELTDVDSDHLSLAEIGFDSLNHSPVNDELLISDSTNIKVIYDPGGVLFLVGFATLKEYEEAIRSIRYSHRMTFDENGNPAEILSDPRNVYITLHDGQIGSQRYEREITMETKIALDIPNTFTPNGDSSNDTWKITSSNINQLDKAVIRVYNKRGLLLYEAVGFENEWDGAANGQPLPVDTYYYTIDLNLTYMKQTYKGIVTILY